MRGRPFGAVVALVCAWPMVARADVWAEVAGLLETLEYDAAIEKLEQVVTSPMASAGDRVRALELVGVAHVGAGRDDEALAVFRRLRRLDPGRAADDPDYSPKIRELFERAEGPVEVGELAVALEPLGEDAEDAEDAEVGIRFDRRSTAIESVTLRARFDDSGPYRSYAVRLGRLGGVARVPILRGTPGDLRLRVVAEARAPSGVVVARAGTQDAPVVLTVPVDGGRERAPFAVGAEPSTPLTGRWWFWTGIGAVVVAGTVIAVAVASGGGDFREGSLGSQQMR